MIEATVGTASEKNQDNIWLFESKISKTKGMNNNHKLDNPVWHCINDVHTDYSIVYDAIKFYKPEYCPFGGFMDRRGAMVDISNYSKLRGTFFVIGDKPLLNDEIHIEENLLCNQMILNSEVNVAVVEEIVPLKSEVQKRELSDLINFVQPGYFQRKTADLGRYFGIYKDGKLVAVSGERMSMNEYTEMSSIVTHPMYTGNGYASQLIKFTSDKIFEDNKLAFLHVLESNRHAIRIYEKLGFVTRRTISFWKLAVR